MKIQSYELQMESHYSFTQELLSARTSFESFLPDEVFAKQDEIKGNAVLGGVSHECECDHSYDRPRTLFSIMEGLMQSLRDRVESQVASIEEMAENSRVRSSQRLSLYERYSESESFSFSTTGIIKTDTQEINIDIDFSMSRSFVVENRIDTGRVFDPLVINYNGELPELSETRFSFDLDNDGEEDQISHLKEGSGFLALDKNEDGKINQGSELFGTLLGNGFAELAQYDDDHNNWIDENDKIWDKLRIWNGGMSEERELLALGEVGIGAIYLNATEADFTYKTAQNETLGELRASGIYLQENGIAGTISQIDFDLGKGDKKEDRNTPLGKLLQA
ncbi:MAG: hypothetical protein COA44_15275 [Arcobacter sp.]|nr:MAG: hypothetical protein COA44_15275 [Arcobacter sp.]